MQKDHAWRLGRRPALDGVRALAVLAVLAHHAEMVPVGYIGVDVFFTLSGFLITSLLLEEHARTGSIDVVAFWQRRARRLLPALTVIVGVVSSMALVGAGSSWITPSAALSALTFTTNWYLLSEPFTALSHTWSLGVEEQFYVTWPLAALLVCNRWGRRCVLVVALWAAIAFSTWAFLLTFWSTPEHRAFGFDARVAPILMGCALAAWMHDRRVGAAPRWVAPIALSVLGAVTVGIVPPQLTAPIAVVLVWATASGTSVRYLEWSALTWVGIRSYGVYLWHAPIVFVLLGAYDMSPILAMLLGAFLSLVAAGASYAFIERPFTAGSAGRERSAPSISQPRTS